MSNLVGHSVGFGPGPYPVYYERIDPKTYVDRPIVIMVHGGAHTGSCFQRTADGRPGWAYAFAARGYPAVVVDWPGHGRSGAVSAEQMTGETVCRSIADLIDELEAPVVLLTHSMGGALGWRILELRASKIEGVVAVAPGPPGNIQEVPEIVRESATEVVIETNGGTRTISTDGLTFMPRSRAEEKLIGESTRFPYDCIDDYVSSLSPYSSRLVYERSNVNGTQVCVTDPSALSGKRVLILTGTSDFDHSRKVDEKIVGWICAHGGAAEHLWLGDLGIEGNGHMLMMESNSDEIAGIAVDWLDRSIGPNSS